MRSYHKFSYNIHRNNMCLIDITHKNPCRICSLHDCFCPHTHSHEDTHDNEAWNKIIRFSYFYSIHFSYLQKISFVNFFKYIISVWALFTFDWSKSNNFAYSRVDIQLHYITQTKKKVRIWHENEWKATEKNHSKASSLLHLTTFITRGKCIFGLYVWWNLSICTTVCICLNLNWRSRIFSAFSLKGKKCTYWTHSVVRPSVDLLEKHPP